MEDNGDGVVNQCGVCEEGFKCGKSMIMDPDDDLGVTDLWFF